jgi:N-dimethylarginine dimethylaminohydrolase
MKRVLMCWPDYFDVIYNINHWMEGQEGRVDPTKAKQQWGKLVDAVAQVATIHFINGVQGLPDLVFTANAGIVQDQTVVVSTFSTKERQPEEAVFSEWFTEEGYTVKQIKSRYEGEGDHLIDNKGRHWMGSGFRSDKSAAIELEEILNVNIHVLELVDPRWYHLDTAFCPLPDGGVMWYPGAFSLASQHLIRSTFAINIELSLADALKFGANCVGIEENLFMPQGTEVVDKLRRLNYNVWEGDLSEFLKAGGAAKCLVLNLNYEPIRK